jgi:hypothetical protein
MVALMVTNPLKAGAPTGADESKQVAAPASLTATVGELLIRIDGTLLRWTPARIEYADTLMAVEGSVFSTVVTYPGGKHLGVSHYIEVPGNPDQPEKEEITDVRFLLDGHPLTKLADTMRISGKSFLVERISKIRTFDVDSRVKVEDGMLTQWVRIQTPTAVELQTMFALAVPWNVTMTEFLFGDDAGPRKQGKFNTATTKPSEGLEKDVRWLAVYDLQSGKGGVTFVAAHPKDADAWFQYTDAPAAYRKQRLMSFVEKTVPAGFDGTYCMVTGFFSASPDSWQAAALKRANELKNYAATMAQP